MYSKEEILKLSVVEVFNPAAFNQLGNFFSPTSFKKCHKPSYTYQWYLLDACVLILRVPSSIFLGTNDHVLEERYLLGLWIDPSDHCGSNVVVVLVFEYINTFGGFDICGNLFQEFTTLLLKQFLLSSSFEIFGFRLSMSADFLVMRSLVSVLMI